MRDASPRTDLFGCPVDRLDLEQTVHRVRRMLDAGGPHRHVCVSAAKIHSMHADAALRDAVVSSDLISADGAGVLVAARLLGLPVPPRVTGIALFLRLVRLAADEGRSVYLLGDRPHVVEAVSRKLGHAWPGLRVVGAHHGFFGEADAESVAHRIADAAPELLFVGMGTPAQELFQHRWQPRMRVPLSMGVGGSFEVVANLAWRAPPAFSDHGLEWLYRLAQDPQRLWRRNVIDHGGFLGQVIGARLRGYRLPGR